jgi:hypothetical protein
MRRFLYASVVGALLIPAALFAGDKNKKNKKTVPAVFGTAKYVYVQTEDGDVYTPGLFQEDRQAVFDVEDALRKWNRYTLTVNRSEAELVFYVRKGRLASGKLGGTVGTPGQGPFPGQRGPGGGRPGLTAGGEAGPPDDLLEVRMQGGDGQKGAQVWLRSQTDGLNAPRVPLLGQLEAAVERDYPQ